MRPVRNVVFVTHMVRRRALRERPLVRPHSPVEAHRRPVRTGSQSTAARRARPAHRTIPAAALLRPCRADVAAAERDGEPPDRVAKRDRGVAASGEEERDERRTWCPWCVRAGHGNALECPATATRADVVKTRFIEAEWRACGVVHPEELRGPRALRCSVGAERGLCREVDVAPLERRGQTGGVYGRYEVFDGNNAGVALGGGLQGDGGVVQRASGVGRLGARRESETKWTSRGIRA